MRPLRPQINWKVVEATRGEKRGVVVYKLLSSPVTFETSILVHVRLVRALLALPEVLSSDNKGAPGRPLME